ncbi:MAG: hypothetical protein AB2L20_13960 [Mangrovibacterium sp.]
MDYSILIFTRLSDKPVRGPIHVVRQGSATIDRAGTGGREESRQVQQDDSNEKDNRFGWVRLVHSTVTDKGANKQKTSVIGKTRAVFSKRRTFLYHQLSGERSSGKLSGPGKALFFSGCIYLALRIFRSSSLSVISFDWR